MIIISVYNEKRERIKNNWNHELEKSMIVIARHLVIIQNWRYKRPKDIFLSLSPIKKKKNKRLFDYVCISHSVLLHVYIYTKNNITKKIKANPTSSFCCLFMCVCLFVILAELYKINLFRLRTVWLSCQQHMLKKCTLILF